VKNKKRLNIIVAVFALTFIAGGVFAFTSAGPLLFGGAANVNASLKLIIDDYEILQGNDLGHQITPRDGHFNWGGGGRGSGTGTNTSVDWEIGGVDDFGRQIGPGFTRPGQVFQVRFDIFNSGTMPASVDSIAPVGFNFNNISSTPEGANLSQEHLNMDISGELATPGTVLQPGERRSFIFTLDTIGMTSDTHYVAGNTTGRIELTYSPAQ